LNKIDRVPEARRQGLAAGRPDSVAVSGQTGEGLDDLRQSLSERLAMAPRAVRLRFQAGDTRAIAGVYRSGRVVSHEVRDDEVILEVLIPERLLPRYREHLA
jgi:50S ribosomal subunit-associated GTPase HflX